MIDKDESIEGDWLLIPEEGAKITTNLGNKQDLPSIEDAEWVMDNYEYFIPVMDELATLGCPRTGWLHSIYVDLNTPDLFYNVAKIKCDGDIYWLFFEGEKLSGVYRDNPIGGEISTMA